MSEPLNVVWLVWAQYKGQGWELYRVCRDQTFAQQMAEQLNKEIVERGLPPDTCVHFITGRDLL